ncbi:1,2-phenylacetyl-CoA epoxidase subunit PaaC [Streptomyces sp. 184]|uniref:1,2-phenylacetyl-CoA epoxidase subunit PaaC n=1 Tax=Streptomyces sp. 184 TaxID=1827526 RepID=UPI0038916F7F
MSTAPDPATADRATAVPEAAVPAAPDPATAGALALGDDALVLSHRLAEWTGHAPVLEEEVALANIALDLLGQARTLLSLVGDEDELAFRREERAFLNVQLVEQPNGDFAHTIARQLYFSVYQELLYGQVAAGAEPAPLAPLAAKAVKEVAYHRDHAEQWTLRLGDGTETSRARMQSGLDALWRYTGELFRPVEGVAVDWAGLEAAWLRSVGDVLERATLTLPEGPRGTGWSAGAGREGVHTESFGRMLAEMQHLHRSHPGASW